MWDRQASCPMAFFHFFLAKRTPFRIETSSAEDRFCSSAWRSGGPASSATAGCHGEVASRCSVGYTWQWETFTLKGVLGKRVSFLKPIFMFACRRASRPLGNKHHMDSYGKMISAMDSNSCPSFRAQVRRFLLKA